MGESVSAERLCWVCIEEESRQAFETGKEPEARTVGSDQRETHLRIRAYREHVVAVR